MLLLRLHLLAADGAELRELRGLIVSGENELLSRFYCALETQQHQFIEGILGSAPRWAEPIQGFVARCLASISDADFELMEVLTYSQAHLRVLDARRGMKEVAKVAVLQSCDYQTSNPWRLVRNKCIERSFGRNQLPSMPSAIAPQVYELDGLQFCRLSELPRDAANAAQWVFKREHRLQLNDVTDAISPEQMHAFLSNNAQVPRPFGGWLWP